MQRPSNEKLMEELTKELSSWLEQVQIDDRLRKEELEIVFHCFCSRNSSECIVFPPQGQEGISERTIRNILYFFDKPVGASSLESFYGLGYDVSDTIPTAFHFFSCNVVTVDVMEFYFSPGPIIGEVKFLFFDTYEEGFPMASEKGFVSAKDQTSV